METINLIINQSKKIIVKGQTCTAKESTADSFQFQIKGNFKIPFSCTLQLNNWQTGEIDIVCVEAIGANLLNTVIGRMRLSIYQHKADKHWFALKTAQLKNQSPPHANLFQTDLDFYREVLGFNLQNFLQTFGECDVDTKHHLINETGKSKNLLAVVYPKQEVKIPLAAFVASRIFPLLMHI